MELNSSINTFYKGLNLDSDVSVLDNNTIRYAENIKLVANGEGTSVVIQNSDYIQKYNFTLPFPFTNVIGLVESKYCECIDDVCSTPKDCAAIFTNETYIIGVDGKPNTYINRIYRIDFDKVDSPVLLIAEGYFGWRNRLSLVSNFESCKVSNVYVADGEHTLRVVNIAETYENINETVFDMFPAVTLAPFTFDSFVTGNLRAGKVLYAYQLFSEHGTASALSPMSGIIPISSTIDNTTSESTKGSVLNEVTQLGVKLNAIFINNGFDRLRIYRLHYDVAGQAPTVYLADEIKITKNYEQQLISYVDFGANYVSVTTIDEFNALTVPYQFVAQTLESKDNRLFAANVQEDTWDVEYDARAYRADSTGKVVLKDTLHGDLEFDINNIPDIDTEHDCLNPSNMDMFSQSSFKYIYGNNTLGGIGKNVSYEFIFIETVLSSESTTTDTVANNLRLNTDTINNSVVNVLDCNGNVINTIDVPEITVRNYSDAYMCSNFLGYQRDEIYRFGIVFYNNKGVATPVHWIGDIRMPCNKIISDKDSVLHPFHVGSESEAYEQTVELLGYALGIKFTVNNIPDEAVAYEIVRCERTGENRTIVTQAVISSLIAESGYSDYYADYVDTWLATDGIGEKGIYPQFLLNFSKKFNTMRHSSLAEPASHHVVDNYYEIISPEICVSLKETAALINNALLCRMNGLYSYPNVLHNDTWEQISIAPIDLNKLDGETVENGIPIIIETLTSSYGSDLFLRMTGDNARGWTNLFKYYNVLHENVTPAYYSILECIAPEPILEISKRKELKATQMPINNKSYMNLSVGSNKQYGRHGKNLIIQTEDAFANSYPYFTVDKDLSPCLMNCTAVYNVKQNSKIFNGVYSDRLNSSYIGCNAHKIKTKDNDADVIYCFGGDTYLGVLDYLNTAFHQHTNDYEDNESEQIHSQCYIPFETTVNLNTFINDEYHNTISEDGMSALNLIQSEPVSFSSYVQTKPQYAYNTIYSQQSDGVKFVPKLRYSYDDLNTPNRIIASEVKTNLELSDSWVLFKYANYLDVDNQYGPITNLKTFGDKLYFFQDNAVGIASVNERSLITDNIAQLTIGTGDVLSRYDYLDTTNGNSIINDRSIVNSSSTLYWYDYNKNEICAINNSVIELSKIKQVLSYFNLNKDKKRTEPVSLFNKKYNEIWFKVLDKTLVFNEQLNVFTSFYTHSYDYALTFGDKLITLKDTSFYEHNETVNGDKEVESLISKLHFIVNDNYSNTKVFDNVSFDANFAEDVDNITNVYFTTKSQTSETLSADNIECREDTYRFSIPRELVTVDNPMSYLGRMRGKYLNEFYTFDCNDNKTFKIPYIKTTYRQSKL